MRETKRSAARLALADAKERARAIQKIAGALVRKGKAILAANRKDLAHFAGEGVMRERLALDIKKLGAIARGVLSVAHLKDPLRKVLEKKILKNGLVVKKISVPLGVVGVIYESRPNVTVDLVVLALKTGNGIVLKGGKESYHTNKVLVSIMQKALVDSGLPKDAILLIDPATDWREELLNAHGIIDVLIPRGGAGLINFVREHSKIPVIETGAGVCHTFLDEKYDLAKASEIIVGTKVQRPSVCNALDTLVVHKKILKPFFERSGYAVAKKLASFGVEIFADKPSYAALKGVYPPSLLRRARSSDYGKEFLALKMSVKTVPSFEAGLSFVQQHTSGHSESILTSNKRNAQRFLQEVDAAVVYENASTRFTDGGEFGMGAEVGVSTQKLHARGPMGTEALTSYKWIVSGKGQMRK